MLNSANSTRQYRYYRANNAIGIGAYDSLCLGLKRFDAEVRIDETSAEKCEALISCVSDDEPLSFQARGCTAFRGKGFVLLKPNYLLEKNEYLSLVEKVNKSIKQTCELVVSDDEWDTLINLHAFILSNWEYKDFGYDAHTVIGPAIYATGVCQGISKYVKLICDYLGIDCVVVSGTAVQNGTGLGGNHSWNAIKISGEWYYFDFTFDLTMSKSCSCESICFDYFAITKQDIDKDHFGASVDFTSGKRSRDYFSERKLIVKSPMELETLLNRAKSKEVFFKVDYNWKTFNFDKEMSKALSEEKIQNKYDGMSYEYSWNDVTRTFYVKFM